MPTINDFKNTMSRFATGITIVLFETPDRQLHGMTVNSFNSVSLNPPMILYSVNKANKNLDHYLNAEKFSVNILTENQSHLSNYFATKDKDLTTFDDYSLTSDVPIINNTMAYLVCKLCKKVEAGDHFIVVAEVTEVFCDSKSTLKPLIYFGSEYKKLL